jgi:hypothetical protein
MTLTLKKSAEIIQLPQGVRSRALSTITDVKVNVNRKLDYLLNGLSDNVEHALFEEMWGLDEKDALRHHFNVMRALKVNGEDFRQEFSRLQNEVWQIFIGQREDPVLKAPRGIAETLISTFKRKTESHYKVLIRDIRDKFSLLLWRELDDFPLCPDMYYLCFWQSVEKLGLSYDERVMLIPLFHRFVMDRYGQVLAIANQTLVEHSVNVESKSH